MSVASAAVSPVGKRNPVTPSSIHARFPGMSLAMTGVPFRTAYKATGALVRACQERGLPLSKVTVELAQSVDPRFDAKVLESADPRRAVERKANTGGTGPASVEKQLVELKSHAARARSMADAIPRLSALFDSLQEAAL